MTTLSEKEVAAIQELRKRLADIEPELDDFFKHDYTLLRFLRARDLNLDKAEEMFRNNQKWRKEHLPQILSAEPDPEIVKRFRFKLSGYDEEGRYLLFFPIGRYDYRWVVENKKEEAYRQFALKTTEYNYALCKYKSTPDNFVFQSISVADYDAFSLKHFTGSGVFQFMKRLMGEMEPNYPEIVKAMIGVNTPSVFAVVFNMFKPFMPKATLEKIQIYGHNATEWRNVVRKLAPADQIPSEYGGANTTCFYYSFENGLDLTPKLVTLPEKDMKQVTVPAGQKELLDFDIPEAATVFNWNFKTDDYDIGFYVYYGSVSDENEIVSCPRCDAHINVQKGSLRCDKPGKYILCFDNSYSKLRSKMLYYVTQIVPASC